MDIKEYDQFNGKRKELEYLAKQGIPVPESYGTINLGQMLKGAMPKKLILRSGEGDGFEGLFQSPTLGLKTEQLEEYCKYKGLNIEDIIANTQLDVQKYYNYGLTGKMYQHPHKENTYFISIDKGFDHAYEKLDSFNLEKNNEEINFPNEEIKERNSKKSYDFLLPNLIKAYDLVSSKYTDEWVREMEFGIGLNDEDIDWHCLQTRKFRKKEKANWTLDISKFPKMQTSTQVFGITPKEGLEMNLFYPDWATTIYYNKDVKKIKGENLLFQAPIYPDQKIPIGKLSDISGLIFNSNGVLGGDHAKTMYAKDAPILIFKGNESFGLEDDNEREERRMESKVTVPVRVYSDGLNAAIEKI